MSAKKIFWTEGDETVKCWEDVQKYEKKFFPVTKHDDRQFLVAAPRWVFRAAKSKQNLETGLQEKFKLNGVRKEDKVKREKELIRAFQRKAALYLEREPDKYKVMPNRSGRSVTMEK